MAKFSFGIDGSDEGAAEGFPPWEGPIPPVGSYGAKLKVARLTQIKPGSANQGKTRVFLLAEVTDEGPYKGYPAMGGVNVIDGSLQFVNQWLRSLTDGSEEQFLAVKRAFYREGKGLRPGTDYDEENGHIKRIGKWLVNSPKGEIPVKVTLKPSTYQGNTTAQVATWLVGAGGMGSSGPMEEPVEEEAAVIDVDEDEGDSQVDESIFDSEEETTSA